MKRHLIGFYSLIALTILIIFANYKQSGGDIFVQIVIVTGFIAICLITGIIRLFKNFNIGKNLLWTFFGFVISYLLFFIANSLAVK